MPNPQSQFVRRLRPVLEAGDADALVCVVQTHYSMQDMGKFLQAPCGDARQIAALALGMIGGCDAICRLAKALHDPEPYVAHAAEHALWSLWFRLGCCKAQATFKRGVDLISEERYEQALESLHEAIQQDAQFAEARNQCAIALFMLERYEETVRRCEETIALMPCHFGAMAGMGHAYVQMGCLSKALCCYRKARQMNPHLPCLAEHIAGLESQLDRVETTDTRSA